MAKHGPENLMCVAPADVEAIWPAVSQMIDSAYAALDEVTPDVLSWLVAKKGLLWVLVVDQRIVAACTSSLVRYRGGLACRVVSVGGSQAQWVECIAAMERYAKDEGCYKVIFDGRRGWSRVLPGYEPVCVSFEKRI